MSDNVTTQDLSKEFRTWLVDIMILHDLSPNGLAKRCDLTLDVVDNLLVNSQSLPPLKTMRRIERAFDMPLPATLLGAPK